MNKIEYVVSERKIRLVKKKGEMLMNKVKERTSKIEVCEKNNL